jgi:plasmid stabilization system protein ParE
LRGLLEIEVLERARDDIFHIIEYGTQEHGEEVARAYVDKIGVRINWLSENPKLGLLHSDLRGCVRSFRQGQHRIYYVPSAKKLTVARILHVSMDVLHQFE